MSASLCALTSSMWFLIYDRSWVAWSSCERTPWLFLLFEFLFSFSMSMNLPRRRFSLLYGWSISWSSNCSLLTRLTIFYPSDEGPSMYGFKADWPRGSWSQALSLSPGVARNVTAHEPCSLLTFLVKCTGLLYLLKWTILGVDLSPYDLRLVCLTELWMLA